VNRIVFGGDHQLRSKIRPLEIVRSAREDRRTIGAPARPVGRPALSLKKRGLSRS